MKLPLASTNLCCLAALFLSSHGFSQALYIPRYQEPRPFTFQVTQASLGAYAEGTFDETSYQNSAQKFSHVYLFAGPALGLAANGSVYHPNFMTWQFNSDGAVGWNYDEFRSGGASTVRKEFQYLGRFSFSLELLPSKPYHATAFVDYDRTFRDNDFFTRVIVESWRYGGRAGWHVGKWDFDANYYHRDEDAENRFPGSTNILIGSQHTLTHEDVITFVARNERDRGGTTLSYNWDQYTRSDLGIVGEGTDQSVSIGDNEHFGSQDQARLNNTASFFRRESIFEVSDEFLAHSSLNIDHTDHLRTFYDFDYDRFSLADFKSGNIGGQAGVQHQLYESLNSTLFVHGSDFSTDSDLGSTDVRRLGGGWAEAYTKHFSEEHRLRLANTLQIDHTDQEINTPHLVAVRNESHTFAEGGGLGPSFTLNLPDVVESSIVITDNRDTQPPYVAGFDYRVVQNGSRTVIEQPAAGSRIGSNQVVHVSYNAAASPSGSYNTFTETAEIRFDLWKNLIGVYGRVALSLNDAPLELRVQEVRAFTLGTDLTWRWLHTGAEYLIYDSTQSDYRSARLFQSLVFHPDPLSNAGLDLTEAWIDYVNANRQEQDFTGIFRYHRALTSRLGLDADAGVSYRTGNGVDQLLATFRPSIKYVLGKLSVDAGYDYEYELFLNNQQRQKHMFFLRLKRYF